MIYLRDNKPTIPFPNHWDLFGGAVEKGESPEEALVREIHEELGIWLDNFHKFGIYECLKGDIRPNIKHVFWAVIDKPTNELVLHEGQRLQAISFSEQGNFKFANILGRIVSDFTKWYEDQFKRKFDSPKTHRNLY